MAGLAACGALAPHVREIILVERDTLSDTVAPRRRIPQAAHVHTLLDGGRAALQSLFPGFQKDLEDAGSLPLRVRSQWRTHNGHQWCDPGDTGPVVLSQSRALLETVLRRHVLSLPGLRLVKGEVTGLRCRDNGRLAGVTLLDADGASSRINADLVIDASGRAGHSLSWLMEIGHATPPTQTGSPDVAYASTCFARMPGQPASAWLKLAQTPDTRSLFVAPIEGNRWIVTLTGRFGAPMPLNEDSFRALLAEVADPHLANLLHGAPIVAPIRGVRIPTVRFRRFDLPEAGLPAGYLPIGDTIATFNPLYGQGMSVGALQAVALRDALRSSGDLDAIQALYLDKAIRPACWAWSLGQAVDRAYEPLSTNPDPESDLLADTLRRAFALPVMRPDQRARIDRVLHLLDPPSVLHVPAAQVS